MVCGLFFFWSYVDVAGSAAEAAAFKRAVGCAEAAGGVWSD